MAEVAGRSRPSRPPLLLDSELTTAVLRAAAGAAMVVLWLADGLADGYGVAGPLIFAAMAYSLVIFAIVARRYVAGDPYPRLLTASLTLLDNAIILGLSAVTGGVSSLLVGVLVLVITTDAARFGVRLAVLCAIADSVVLLVMGLVVDEPHVELADRVRLIGWWAWLLIGGAVLAGMIARAAFEARHDRDVAQQQAAIDRMEREIERQARLELEAADADRREFLRVITHELRTPITSIGALSRALAAGAARLDGPQREEALSLVQSHADHLSHLLESVRDLATATVTGQQRTVLSDVALLDLVRTSASAAGLDAARLQIDLADGTELIRTDAEKLRRILTNLLENAGRHSLEAICVEARLDQRLLTIRVLDRGPGLTDDVASRAFEKGFSFGTERGSSGLGLWIVRELATVIGGRVWAEPRPGGGLIVHVSLPVLRPVTGTPSSPALQP
ncbi:MAG: hypothetical protein QOJ67_2686 [Acidimicrobiaceae bacterium]